MIEDNFDIKDKILGVLDALGMSEKRAATLDLDDFLK